jgi:hypothetical protein
MSERSILTGLRLPEDLDAQVRRVAARSGVSKNALIKIILAGALARAAERTALTADELRQAEAVVAAALGRKAPP